MMRWKLLGLVFFLAISLAAAAEGSSTTHSDFTIQGCTLDSGEGVPVGSCSNNGYYFCPDDGSFTAQLTTKIGSTNAVSGACSATNCCPAGFYCDGQECILNNVDCSEFDGDSAACFANNCFYDEAEDFCINNPRELSCSSYSDEDSCNEDVLNLGRQGLGTEVCGTYFNVGDYSYLIPPESCQCEWGGPLGKEQCNLTYSVRSEFFGIGVEPNNYNCQKHSTFGECLDFKRTVNWEATPVGLTGQWSINGEVPIEELKGGNCISSSETRSCGRPLFKLPGFSLFAFISSLVLVFAIYFLKKGNFE